MRYMFKSTNPSRCWLDIGAFVSVSIRMSGVPIVVDFCFGAPTGTRKTKALYLKETKNREITTLSNYN